MQLYLFFSIYSLLLQFPHSETANKYSAEANKNASNILNLETPTNFRTLDKPFRMAKLNMLWSKARLRITEPKLKSLFSDLKIHDKEEITWKRLRSEGHDKEGLKEAELRKKLFTIMSQYGLLEYFEETNNPEKVKDHLAGNDQSQDYLNKALFKDKKLNQLWLKAERSGFTAEELQALKEEFEHHQDKIDQYYAVLKNVEQTKQEQHENSVDEKLDRFNMLNDMEESDEKYSKKANKLRDMHQEIRDGYDRLHRVTAKGPKSKEFIEPKVQGLWRLAVGANFTPDELESLRTELLHYENRLLKLRHLHAEAELNSGKRAEKLASNDPPEGMLLMEETIKKHMRKVEKLHLDLETKIMRRHIEL